MTPNTQRSSPIGMKWSIGALMHAVADALSARFGVVTVTGELSQLTRAASGHWYFTLKDDKAAARCVMFRAKNSLVDFAPREGQLVELRAQVSVYEPRGDLQLVVESMKPGGLGALYEQFLALKAKLESEGLFEAARKRPIAPLPRAVGLITSRNAAALRDVLTAFARRAPHVALRIYPATVQGANAAQEIADALHTANKRAAKDQLDTLLLVRGGGSLEDLMAFNDERVARAVAASQLPVICGVGHETDFTIADFVADLRAATPTAAAELAATPREEWLAALHATAHDLMDSVSDVMSGQGQRLDAAEITLGHMRQAVHTEHAKQSQGAMNMRSRMQQRMQQERHTLDMYGQKMANYMRDIKYTNNSIDIITQRLQGALRASLMRRTQQLDAVERTAAVLSPQRTLERGYSVLLSEGHAVTSVSTLNALTQVRAVLADGEADLLLTRQASLL
jgi:exodeoxyribonuclease VII large subunit